MPFDRASGESFAMSSGLTLPMQWPVEDLWQQLEPLLPGLSVEVLPTCPSTNSALLERARTVPGRRSADAMPCLLVAEDQTVGRGRMGRPWKSRPGASLTFSLSVPVAAADWSGLSLAVGVALAEALQSLLPASERSMRTGAVPEARNRVGLKWPNDLWLDDRKLGGILIESVAAGNQRLAVIGCGLNVLPMVAATHAPGFGSGFACARELRSDLTPPLLLSQLALPLVRAVLEFERDGFAAFAARFARLDVLAGREVHTMTPAGTDAGFDANRVEGTAAGVDAHGALQVRTAGGMKCVSSGEVSVRLNPATASERH
jgi:BirA family biotin operon repressor/biotin-[acetyl-CoA-carboxylase] ligase